MSQVLLQRDRHIPDGNFHDEEALLKKVIDLKSQQIQLKAQEEQCSLTEKKMENITNKLKQEYNIIAASAEIHGWNDLIEPEIGSSNINADNEMGKERDNGDNIGTVSPSSLPPTSSSTPSPFTTAEDLRYTEWNRKLELLILNQDIRSAIPTLEKEALNLEANIFAIEKSAKQATEAQKLLPHMLNKTALELEEEMGIVLEKKFQVKALIKRDVDALQVEKMRVVRSVSSLREQLSLSTSEKDVLVASTVDRGRSDACDMARLKVCI